MNVSTFFSSFNNVKNQQPINVNHNNPSIQYFRNDLKSDVFERTSPSFHSQEEANDKSFESFIKWANDTDFLDNIEDMANNSKNIIGSGFEGITYKIPDNDKWIIKKNKKNNILPIKTQTANIQRTELILPCINAGQCIAIVNIPLGFNSTSRYYILQKQEGNPIGLQYLKDEENDTILQNINLRSLEKLANAPEKTFEKLLDNIKYVIEEGYELDVLNPQNFLFDEKKQEINFVDVNDELLETGNNYYGDVLFAILGGFFTTSLMTSEGNEEAKQKTAEFANKIAQKYFSVMNEKGLKFVQSVRFCELLESSAIDKTFETSKYNEKIEHLKELNLI